MLLFTVNKYKHKSLYLFEMSGYTSKYHNINILYTICDWELLLFTLKKNDEKLY